MRWGYLVDEVSRGGGRNDPLYRWRAYDSAISLHLWISDGTQMI